MPFPYMFGAAALIASAAFLFGVPAEATEKKKPAGGYNFSGSAKVTPSSTATGKKSSGGSNYSGRSGGSSSRNLAAGAGAAIIGYGLSGGLQNAIENAKPDRRDRLQQSYDQEDMQDNIRSRTPEELKKLRATAKGRKQQQEADADAEATRATMNLFLGIGGFGR